MKLAAFSYELAPVPASRASASRIKFYMLATVVNTVKLLRFERVFELRNLIMMKELREEM